MNITTVNKNYYVSNPVGYNIQTIITKMLKVVESSFGLASASLDDTVCKTIIHALLVDMTHDEGDNTPEDILVAVLETGCCCDDTLLPGREKTTSYILGVELNGYYNPDGVSAADDINEISVTLKITVAVDQVKYLDRKQDKLDIKSFNVGIS